MRASRPRVRMEFEAWEPFYEEILKDFGFSREKDEAVAVELDKLPGGEPGPPSSPSKIIRGEEETRGGKGPKGGQGAGGARGGFFCRGHAAPGGAQERAPSAGPA